MDTTESTWHGTVPLTELPDGGMTSVDVGDQEVLLARVGDAVFALDNVCTHAEGWLDMGTLHSCSYEVECPLHQGRFDLRTGTATRQPCESPLRRFEVQVVDGLVHVLLP